MNVPSTFLPPDVEPQGREGSSVRRPRTRGNSARDRSEASRPRTSPSLPYPARPASAGTAARRAWAASALRPEERAGRGRGSRSCRPIGKCSLDAGGLAAWRLSEKQETLTGWSTLGTPGCFQVQRAM